MTLVQRSRLSVICFIHCCSSYSQRYFLWLNCKVRLVSSNVFIASSLAIIIHQSFRIPMLVSVMRIKTKYFHTSRTMSGSTLQQLIGTSNSPCGLEQSTKLVHLDVGSTCCRPILLGSLTSTSVKDYQHIDVGDLCR